MSYSVKLRHGPLDGLVIELEDDSLSLAVATGRMLLQAPGSLLPALGHAVEQDSPVRLAVRSVLYVLDGIHRVAGNGVQDPDGLHLVTEWTYEKLL